MARQLLLAVFLLSACGGPPDLAPAPLRPKARKAPPKRGAAGSRTDCEPLKPGRELPALKFDERSIEESENLAEQGFNMLKASETRAVTRPERERLVTQAVRRFITSLAADPYNVHATYNLAAAYARIRRSQCTLNLLDRLRALRKLHSHREEVEVKLDRLFGRKQFDGSIDPDFLYLRDDPRFRTIARDLQ